MRGIVAAGHPLTAGAGADVLRAGGNAVDAALAAMCTSFVTEPLLTGLGAGGYMLVAAPGQDDILLDFFVPAPSEGERAPLVPVDVSFGDAVQVFNIGASSCGAYGTPAGIWAAAERYGSMPLARAGGAGGRAGARGRRRQRPAGVPVRHPLADHGAHARVARAVPARRAAAARGRALRDCRRSPTRWSAWPPRARAVLHRRRGAGGRGVGGRARRDADARGPRRPTRRCRASRCGSPTAAARCSPTRRRARAGRCSPTRSRCSTARTGRRPRPRSSARWSGRRRSARRRSSRGSTRRRSWRPSWRPGSGRRRTSR